jgi:hypothetical protein
VFSKHQFEFKHAFETRLSLKEGDFAISGCANAEGLSGFAGMADDHRVAMRFKGGARSSIGLIGWWAHQGSNLGPAD